MILPYNFNNVVFYSNYFFFCATGEITDGKIDWREKECQWTKSEAETTTGMFHFANNFFKLTLCVHYFVTGFG